VIHRDLKLGNLFLTDDMKLKIGDFGLAARLDSLYDRKKTMCGTPNYIAPEVLQGQEGGGHSFEVDIWSMGVVMYTLLFGKPPFETKEVKDTYKRIRANQYSFPSSVEVSQSAKSLIMDILKTEPTQRPSLDAILAHAFFQDHSVPKFLPKSALIVTPPNKNVLLATKKTSAASISTTKTTTTITTTTTATATIVSSSTTSGRYNITPSSSHHHHHHLHHHHHDQQHQHQHEHHHPEKQQQGQEEYSKDSSSSLSTLHQTYETLHRVFFLREHGERAEKLDEFSNTSTIVAAAKRLKELRLENDARFGGKLVPANLWVSQWVDYTSKYGMGYILSNQCAGVYFNDSTKIIASPNDQKFDYIERHRSWTLENDQDRKHYRMEEYDQSLSKKVTLLTHFRGYLNESRAENVEVAKLEQYFDKNHQFVLSRNEKQPEKPLEYVKKWVKTRHAVLFCLSNGTFQLNFFDSSKLILSNGGRLVT
jgi:polo-like kinase 1